MVALFARAWIEIFLHFNQSFFNASPSLRGRGLKYLLSSYLCLLCFVALFARAWIEIGQPFDMNVHTTSPSLRGRGLK